ncbi:MAG: RluA family pseudouridine synthase [Bacteroidales bacterium]|nr:RluA family pseudouridine synthase [Bacteroidales bacterium]
MQILFEDNHLIAINKGNHDLVQKDKTGDKALDDRLRAYIREKYNKPGNVYLGVTHRLDRPVSGVVLFTRTSKALSRMNAMFRDGQVDKTYWALVANKPPKDKDTLVHYMVKNERQNKSYCYPDPKPDSKRSELSYELLGQSDRYYLLSVKLLTGRHHQIRAQLATMGCQIKGDLKYGYSRSNPDGGISLHAREISFEHPVSKELVRITARPPSGDKLWDYFVEQLGIEG